MVNHHTDLSDFNVKPRGKTTLNERPLPCILLVALRYPPIRKNGICKKT